MIVKVILTSIYLVLNGFLGIQVIHAQGHEVQQLLLNVEKLNQFRDILDQMHRGYDMVSKGYNVVRDVSSGNFQLHKHFLDELWKVSPSVRNYRKVAEIINYQNRLVRLCRDARTRFSLSGILNTQELGYVLRTYDRVLGDSLKHLDELTMVLTAGSLRMSDEQRLAAIDAIFLQVQDKVHFVSAFQSSTAALVSAREKETSELSRLRNIYGGQKGGTKQ